MRVPSSDHFKHHGRFYLSAAFGIGVWLAAMRLDQPLRIVIAGNSFFLLFLASTGLLAPRLGPDDLRRRAAVQDEGIGIIVLVTIAAIALSLGSFAMLLNGSEPGGWHLIFAIVTVPLGWLTLHTVMAFHYAHLFYAEPEVRTGKSQGAGGLAFPGEEEPAAIDFIYYSFVVGMTTQVSDVQATSREMRKVTLVHSVVSFFFNTVILALAVNVAVGQR